MTFNILDCLSSLKDVKEYHTWYLAACPVCGGKLKISKNPSKYGAYACYSEGCHSKPTNLIRKALYKPSPFRSSNKFNPPRKKSPNLASVVKPVSVAASAYEFLTPITKHKKPIRNLVGNKTYTYYDYSKDFRVVRVDLEIDGESSKFLYPEYLVSDGKYRKGVPTKEQLDLPVYKRDYLQESIVLAEGEKSADAGQSIGIATLSLPMFVYSECYLDTYCKKLSEEGVKNVVYLYDNDKVGYTKAKEVRAYLCKNGVGVQLANLADIYTDYKSFEGFDLYDAVHLGLIDTDNREALLAKILH